MHTRSRLETSTRAAATGRFALWGLACGIVPGCGAWRPPEDAAAAKAASRGGAAHRGLLGGVLLLGAWLRIHGFDRPGLWIDEYGTWWVIAADSWAGVAARAWEVQGQSPLYYLIVRGCVDVFGVASWSLRLPSLVLGILALWLGYAVTRALFRDRRLALMTTAALAVHAPLIRYAQEARPYALATVLSLASFALFIRLLRGGGPAARVTYVLATAGSFYAHYLFGFAPLVQACYAVGRKQNRRSTIAALAASAVLMAPGGLQLANLFARRQSIDWLPDPVSIPAALGSVGRTMFDPWPLGLAALSVVALLTVGARPWRGDPGDRPGLVLAWLLIPFAGVALAPSLLGINLIEPRYLLVAAPAARILIGALLALPRRRLVDALPVLIFTGASFFWILLPHHADTGTFALRKDQHWDTAVAEMLAGRREGDAVLFSSGFVEMDQVVAGTARPSTREFVTWPLRAHLPAGVDLSYTPLPYSVSPASRPALAQLLRRALAAERVWVLGAGPSVRAVARIAAADPHIAIAREEQHGLVDLLLVTR